MKFQALICILLLSSIVIGACSSQSTYSGGSSGSGSYSGGTPVSSKKCEIVTIEYEEYEPVQYKVIGEPTIKRKTTGLDYYIQASLSIQNLEPSGGAYGVFQNQFVVNFYFTTAKRGTEKVWDTKDVNPQEIVEFVVNYDIGFTEKVIDTTYEVIPGKKLVTKYREETRC